ncbi:MAG: hypothetical protein QNJ37_08980 [Crocosphaera sp.]|nr:hypothetical protein [Crocosphaera sp.]
MNPKVLIWNLRQNLNKFLGKPPIDCHKLHNPSTLFCSGCEPGQTFKCEQCGRLTSYCNGGDGDELCNTCWSKNQPPEEPTPPHIQATINKASLLYRNNRE